jgi:predicted transcriptional regulator
MAERELVTECNDDGKWQLTQLGSLLVEGLQYALEMAELVVLLRDIPYSEIEVDLKYLQDSKKTYAARERPQGPIDRVLELVQDGDHVRALSPIASQSLLIVFNNRIEQGMDVEIVFEQSILQRLNAMADGEDVSYGGRGRKLLEAPRSTVYSFRDELPFPLALIDETVALGVQGPRGNLHGVIESQSSEVRTWAERFYRDHKDKARLVEA